MTHGNRSSLRVYITRSMVCVALTGALVAGALSVLPSLPAVALTPPAAAAITAPSAAAPAAGSCASADAKLVPACGVWWGMWPRTDAAGTMTNNLPANVASTETVIKRKLDIVSRYKGWGEDIYDAWDMGFRDSGHIVLEDLTTRDFKTNTYVKWADIARGSYDSYLTRQALRAKAFGAKTFFSFNQEPEQALERGNLAGGPADFAAAYRHVRQVFDANGATNVVWVWWVMGYSGHNAAYPTLWPGSAYVDWISYDPYDFNTCHGATPKTTAQTFTPWYSWINSQAWANGKPLMLSEFGSNGPSQQQWQAAVPSVLKGLPRIKAAVLFNSKPGTCDHRVTANAGNLAGYTAASADPYVNPVGSTKPATSCVISDKLVPSCGVSWGIWPKTNAAGVVSSNLPANVVSLESAVKRKFSTVLRYKGWGEQLVDSWDVTFRDTGHTVVEDLSARNFSTNVWASWKTIAAGGYDGYLTTQAKRVAAYQSPIMLSFSGEPEQILGIGKAGSAADYAAAYRHVRQIFDANGAGNAIWVWWMRGSSTYYSSYPTLWPGANYVDWIAYSAFDRNTCAATTARTPSQTFAPFYSWLNSQAWANGKPLMLAAYGTNGLSRSSWYYAVPSALAALPRIKSVISYDSKPGSCDFRWTGSASNLTAFAAAGNSSIVKGG